MALGQKGALTPLSDPVMRNRGQGTLSEKCTLTLFLLRSSRELRKSDHRWSRCGWSQSRHPAGRTKHRESGSGIKAAVRWPNEWCADIHGRGQGIEVHEGGL